MPSPRASQDSEPDDPGTKNGDVQSQRLYRQIAETISGQIRSGEFANGSRLPTERELAKTYSVSRASIREAIIALDDLP